MATLFTLRSLSHSHIIFHSHNTIYRYTQDVECDPDPFVDSPTDCSEGGTPAPPEGPEHMLRFTTAHMPKEPSSGFVFGSDKESCDVLLSPSQVSGISRQQFAITFRPDTMAVILRNLSKRGTVAAPPDEKRVKIMSQEVLERPVHIYLGPFLLQISKQWDADADDKYRLYFGRLGSIDPNIGRLKIHSSRASTASLNEYTLDVQVGEGVAGTVRRAYHKHTGDIVAIKCFTLRDDKALPWRETMILNSLRHEHIIEFHHFVYNSPDSAWMIMEYAEHGDLFSQHQVKKFTGAEGQQTIRQVLLGLQYLHRKKVVHRDVKPGNILITARNPIHIKLADFSHSATVDQGCLTVCGSRRYMAPEVSHPPYTAKVDIWSTGVIALELWAGLPRTTDTGWVEMLQQRISTMQDTRLGEFLRRTLCSKPDDRFTADQCLKMPFLLGQNIPATRQDGQAEETTLSDPQTAIRQDAQAEDVLLPDTAIWNPISCDRQEEQSVAAGTAAELCEFLNQEVSPVPDAAFILLEPLPEPIKLTMMTPDIFQADYLNEKRVCYSAAHHLINITNILRAFNETRYRLDRLRSHYEFIVAYRGNFRGSYTSYRNALEICRGLQIDVTKLESFIWRILHSRGKGHEGSD